MDPLRRLSGTTIRVVIQMYQRDPAPGGSAAVSPSELPAILLAVIGSLHLGLFPARLFTLPRLIV